MTQFQELFEASRQNRSGITLLFPGQSIALVVRTVIGTEALEGFNQEYDRIVVRLDGLLAVAVQ